MGSLVWDGCGAGIRDGIGNGFRGGIGGGFGDGVEIRGGFGTVAFLACSGARTSTPARGPGSLITIWRCPG